MRPSRAEIKANLSGRIYDRVTIRCAFTEFPLNAMTFRALKGKQVDTRQAQIRIPPAPTFITI